MLSLLAESDISSPGFWIENALIVVGGLVLLSIMMRLLRMLSNHKGKTSIPLNPIFIAVRWAGILIIVGLILERFDVQVMTMLTTVLAMIAIGFVAVWSLLSHVMATFILMITKPFRVNDVIGFVGEEIKGEVVDLTLFYTTLRAEDGDEFRIPNNLFFQKSLRITKGKGKVELAEQLKEPEAAPAQQTPDPNAPAAAPAAAAPPVAPGQPPATEAQAVPSTQPAK